MGCDCSDAGRSKTCAITPNEECEPRRIWVSSLQDDPRYVGDTNTWRNSTLHSTSTRLLASPTVLVDIRRDQLPRDIATRSQATRCGWTVAVTRKSCP